ncbi:putative DNA-binding domain-containing protein [Bdellovibrio sp. HCB290]|uniref:HvfC/BufC family peptide modification chaperone n=1 Tax=Bdellovibrio sp. HCB290 TaxID=3394356 RepID=UPI0039B4AFAB
MTINEALHLFKKNVLDGEADAQSIRDLRPVGNISLDQGFEIYHDIYHSKLGGSLGKTYEAVAWVLGRDLFHDLCVRYIESQPSVNFHLSDYGSTFSEYLNNTARTRGIPFLSDLARFEWMIKEVQSAASPNPLPAETIMEQLHTANFRLGFVEAMRIHQSMHSVLELWNRRKEPAYVYEEINWSQPQSLLIYKKNDAVMVEPIDPIHAEVILKLQQGQSISEALLDFSQSVSAEDNTRLFKTLVKAGVIEDFIPL